MTFRWLFDVLWLFGDFSDCCYDFNDFYWFYIDFMMIYVDFGDILELLFAPKSLYFCFFCQITFWSSFSRVLHVILEPPMSILTAQGQWILLLPLLWLFDFLMNFNIILALFWAHLDYFLTCCFRDVFLLTFYLLFDQKPPPPGVHNLSSPARGGAGPPNPLS